MLSRLMIFRFEAERGMRGTILGHVGAELGEFWGELGHVGGKSE